MRQIYIDFGIPKRSTRTGYIVFAMSIVLLMVSCVRYFQLLNVKSTLRANVSTLQGQIAGARAVERPDKAMDAVERELGTAKGVPWAELFRMLEGYESGNVALLAVRPDLSTGKVVLEGEALSYPELLDYLSYIKKSQVLTDVFLKKHQVDTEHPIKPVTFQVTAKWVTRVE